MSARYEDQELLEVGDNNGIDPDIAGLTEESPESFRQRETESVADEEKRQIRFERIAAKRRRTRTAA